LSQNLLSQNLLSQNLIPNKLMSNDLMDPEVAEALATLDLRLGDLSDSTLASVRERMRSIPVPILSDAVERLDYAVLERPPVSVRVHRPKRAEGQLPCIYWMHGGGLVLGRNVGDDPRFDRWCSEIDCVGVSVEYGLAPENQYPEPLEDCYAGLKWVHDHAEQLGVDPQRIGIGGASAGAGLAAGLALLARDRGELAVAFQLLIYPMIDDRQATISSHWDDPVWPPDANRYGWDSYLGGLSGDRVQVMLRLPVQQIFGGCRPPISRSVHLDGFSDEDIEFGNRLRHAGVSVQLHVYAGAPHGFDTLAPATALAQRANRDVIDWLRLQLEQRG
jgi:acetyl esterase/lipase